MDKRPWPVGLLSSLLPSLGQERASTSVCQRLLEPQLPRPYSEPGEEVPFSCVEEEPQPLPSCGVCSILADAPSAAVCVGTVVCWVWHTVVPAVSWLRSSGFPEVGGRWLLTSL